VAEVDADDGTGATIQRQQDRRAALRLLRLGAQTVVAGARRFDDEPRVLQLADEGRDGRAGQSRLPRDLRAAGGAPGAQRVDDATAVVRAERLE
jgi:hypothetical protein